MCSARGSFNSRSPSGLRLKLLIYWNYPKKFQFTQPKRAATPHDVAQLYSNRCFNSRSPSGLRLKPNSIVLYMTSFNSRSPSGLRLCILYQTRQKVRSFNSRSPSGLRQDGLNASTVIVDVSIHAAQAGCDSTSPKVVTTY